MGTIIETFIEEFIEEWHGHTHQHSFQLIHLGSSGGSLIALSISAAMPTPEQNERGLLRKECFLKKKRGTDRKFKEDMLEGMLLTKWPYMLQDTLGATARIQSREE